MSIGSLGNVALSAAGAPLAQTKGGEMERTQQESAGQQRVAESGRKAEAASGIGETDGDDHETAERDADGRRLWEAPDEKKKKEAKASVSASAEPRLSKDASGLSGNNLDLTG
jgi:hypothetical protein